jgi:hypothetical protein
MIPVPSCEQWVNLGTYNNKLGLSAVAVLALLFLTGAYLFVLPYVGKWWRRATHL